MSSRGCSNGALREVSAADQLLSMPIEGEARGQAAAVSAVRTSASATMKMLTPEVIRLSKGPARLAGRRAVCFVDMEFSPHVVRRKMARISPGTHTELRNQTTDLSERAQNILLYKERGSVLTQNDTALFHLYTALKKLLLVYHASFSSARKKFPARVSSWKRGISSGSIILSRSDS